MFARLWMHPGASGVLQLDAALMPAGLTCSPLVFGCEQILTMQGEDCMQGKEWMTGSKKHTRCLSGIDRS